MKSRKWWAVGAAAVAVVALSVFSPGGGTDVVQAKGPNNVFFDVALNEGNPIPAAGSPIETGVQLDIAAGDPSPSESGFFDTTVTTSTGTLTQSGPGVPGSSMAAGAVGARTGDISFSIKTNVIVGLNSSQNVATTGTHAGAVTNCGDNDGVNTTRDYTGLGPAANAMVVASDTFSIFVGDMTERNLRATSLFAPGWVASEYAAGGGGLVQTYDDDNDNGTQDSLEGGVAEPPADAAGTPQHPFATGTAGSTYVTGAPETQHDSHPTDGIPDGLSHMPDFLGNVADALGLAPAWTGRSYGVADVFPGLVAPTDVHFMAFDMSLASGQGGLTFTVLANPFAPANPANQGTITCTAFTTSVLLDDLTTAANMCGNGACVPPAAITDTGDSVSEVISNGAHHTKIFVTDVDDYDQDGLVAPQDLCARDGGTNADPDGDLIAGVCDPNPASWDNDGDGNATSADRALSVTAMVAGTAACETGGNNICDNDVDGDNFANNTDNCETTANPTQEDGDADGVGDACDAFNTIDSINNSDAGKGSGTNTSELIDNDLECTETWSTGGTEAFGDGVGVGPAPDCTNVNDASDDGEYDSCTGAQAPCTPDGDSDEDGDGHSDGIEGAQGTNPLNPNPPFPSCITTNPALDSDGDNAVDTCEAGGGMIVGDPDTDNDGAKDGYELFAGTSPVSGTDYDATPAADTDGDGCNNGAEAGSDASTGGLRHAGNYWDFFDTNSTGAVDLSDALQVLQHFGHAANQDAKDQEVDRESFQNTTIPGLYKEANTGIDLGDALANLRQFGAGGCSSTEGPVPGPGGGITN